MTLDQRVSNLIGRTYETIVSDDTWDGVLDELLDLTGARFGLLAAVDTANRNYSLARYFGLLDTSRQIGFEEYRENLHLTDPSLAYAAQYPHARYCDVRTLADPDQGYMRWHRDRLRSPYWIVAWNTRRDGLTFGVSLHPPEGSELAPGGEALFRLLFEHMARSVDIASRLPAADDARAVFTLGARGAVVHSTPAAQAILDEADGLSLDADRTLRCAAAGDDDALQRTVASALTVLETGACGGACWIGRPSGRRRRLARVAAQPARHRMLAPFQAAATVEIVELDPSPCSGAAWLQAFGFSVREREVAGMLVQGHSVESLSEVLGISSHTVRVHLAALFRKTDTNRQSDLVRVLLRVAG
jgi:DNA-binding CsgD family transcriptional regulator